MPCFLLRFCEPSECKGSHFCISGAATERCAVRVRARTVRKKTQGRCYLISSIYRRTSASAHEASLMPTARGGGP